VKLKLICVALAGALVPITPSKAQSISPAGHYTKKRGGEGKMRVEKTGEGWTVSVVAGGIPNSSATAADCTLIAVGAIESNTFHGEIKYGGDMGDEKPGPNFAVDAGHKLSVAFAPQFAALTTADVGDICGSGTGLFGRYTKDRK
jgi:hypothetical protein